MNNYSKGEWEVSRRDEKHSIFFDGFTLSVNTERLVIALCDRDKWDSKKERLANADLISAAPNMYEALQAIINAEDSIPDYMAKTINKALAKAEGRRNGDRVERNANRL